MVLKYGFILHAGLLVVSGSVIYDQVCKFRWIEAVVSILCFMWSLSLVCVLKRLAVLYLSMSIYSPVG